MKINDSLIGKKIGKYTIIDHKDGKLITKDTYGNIEDNVNIFSGEATLDGYIEDVDANELFNKANDEQATQLLISKDKNFMGLLNVEGFWMADTEGWMEEKGTEEGYEVQFAIGDFTEKLDLNNFNSYADLFYSSEGPVTEDEAIEGIEKILNTFKSNYVDEVDVKDEPQHLTFGQVYDIFTDHNSENGIRDEFSDEHPLYAVGVASNSNFDQEYSLDSRSYKFRSDSKKFLPNKLGSSVFAESLDGSDRIRLDWYLYKQDDGWDWEYFYIIEE